MESLWQEPEAHLGSTAVLPQLGLTASVLLAFLCSLCGVEAWCGKELFQDPRGLWGWFLLFFLHAALGMGEWDRARLLWVVQLMFGVSSPVLPASLLHLVWFGKQLVDLFIPFAIKACVWGGLLAWPQEGLGSCLLAGEGVVGAAEILGGISITNLLCCWTAVPYPARNVGLSSLSSFCWPGCSEEPPAGFGNQLGHPPCWHLENSAARLSWECGQGWELCCSSHISPSPRAPAPALASGRALGAASAQGSGSLGSWSPGSSLVWVQPLVRHSSLLSSARKARAVRLGGKSLPCSERSNSRAQPGSVEGPGGY